MAVSIRAAALCLFFPCLLVCAAEPQISIAKEQPGTVRVRAVGSGVGIELEASTNLSSWSVVASTNGPAVEFLDTGVANFKQRFFRAGAQAFLQRHLRFL